MFSLNFTKRQWCTLLIIGLADFCNAICVSLQAPFFPKEAEKKEATATEYGLVFGIFELMVFIVSPFYGQYINVIGPKVLFNAGIFTTGTAAIAFGLLDNVPGHTLFITLAFVIRIIEAIGNAAFLTASFAIIAKEFPNNIATTFASLETFFGLGLIAGPMVGGLLYTMGGYFLPFVVLGSTLFITAILTLCILPRHPSDVDDGLPGPSMKTVLKIPGVLVCSLGICATSASIGFLGAVLEPHLRQFNLTPVLLGMIFVINGGVYALTAPMWGWCVDKCVNPKITSFIGSIIVVLSFCLIGPTSFLPLETKLSTVIIGLVLHGLGIAALLVSSFTDALRTAVKRGLPDNIETYGLISGLWTSTFALGAFIGPSVSGALYDVIGFRKSTIFIIAIHLLLGIILILFITFERKQTNPYKELKSEESLIKSHSPAQSQQQQSNNNNNIDKTNPTNGLTSAHSSNSVSESCRSNLILCNSYNKSYSQWASLCESQQPPPPPPLGINGISQYYGSIDTIPQRHHSETTIA